MNGKNGQGTHSTKMGADKSAENTPNDPKTKNGTNETLINHYFYNNLCLYIQIPNIYLGLGFEFGPQRIRDLAFLCQ